jgi:hypothetical protein
MDEAFFINAFQETWSQVAVHFNGTTNDLIGKVVQVFLGELQSASIGND